MLGYIQAPGLRAALYEKTERHCCALCLSCESIKTVASADRGGNAIALPLPFVKEVYAEDS